MTIRPAALKRPQPRSRELADCDDRHAGDPSPREQRTSLGANEAYRPYPSSAEWMEKGRTGVGPIVAGVSRRRSQRKPRILSPGRPGQTMTPLTGGPLFL